MDSRISRILPFLFITVGCVVSVELFYFTVEKFVFSEKMSPQVAQEQTIVQPKDKPAKRQTPVDYSIITKRNLFGQPPEKKLAAKQTNTKAEELEPTSLELVLMGTIFGKNDEDRAIILTKKDRKQDIYRVGDQIQGALIKEIRRGSIVLNVDAQDEILDMSEAGKYAPKAPPGPVAANLPRRRAAVMPGIQSDTEPATTTNRLRPRVVRPTRKIISSRRQPAEDAPLSDSDSMEAEEEINVSPSDSDSMEPEAETNVQDITE
ncbi:type II secretion system protein N [Desulfopila sp. IMCC35008]|uniref:type II secretion system protein N n=1 Tax=Desulfopila sp. IMCC35008 TaxID=2653858 RepID=UPI0013D3A726|nr:type II secretion system protein N [Desulfopila sp. IMCC35008]